MGLNKKMTENISKHKVHKKILKLIKFKIDLKDSIKAANSNIKTFLRNSNLIKNRLFRQLIKVAILKN